MPGAIFRTMLAQLEEIGEHYAQNIAGDSAREKLFIQCAKLSEELGEYSAALIGNYGLNPRKGFTHNSGDLTTELIDIIATAWVSLHLLNGFDAFECLAARIDALHKRIV